MKPLKMSRPSLPVVVVIFASFVLVSALVSWLLKQSEAGIFPIIEYAGWLNGGKKPEVVTWPAWGYPWLIALIPSYKLIIIIQSGIGALALTALVIRVWIEKPISWAIMMVLCLLAVPWHNVQTTFYPSALAGSLVLLALLSLDRAIDNNDRRWALLAGILVGLAQNFRSEFVLLPAFLGIIFFGLRHYCILKIQSLKPLWLFIFVALVFQLPWAGLYYSQTGRFSLTESNFGHVLYVSLGSHPDNPWGTTTYDYQARDAVRNEGYTCSSVSEQGNQILLRLVVQKAKMHPYGMVQRTVRQLKNTLLAPFNWGEPKLDEKEALYLDVLREELKSRLGVGVNVRELAEYRSRGLYPDAIRNKAAIFALLYQFVAVGLGSAVLLLGMGGMLIVAFQTTRPAKPLLYLLGCAAVYKMPQDVLLFYQINYLSNVYPMFLPFVSISLITVFKRFRKIN